MNIEVLPCIQNYQIMPVSFMVPEKQILAMSGWDILPVFPCNFYSRKRRMFIKSELDIQFSQNFIYLISFSHFDRLSGKFRKDYFLTKADNFNDNLEFLFPIDSKNKVISDINHSKCNFLNIFNPQIPTLL